MAQTKTQTHTGSSQFEVKDKTGKVLFTLPDPVDVYDVIMGKIELDLVSTAIPLLDEKYKDETPAERKERFARYRWAFEEFKKQYAQWISKVSAFCNSLRKTALHIAEDNTRDKEKSILTELESQFI